MVGKRNIFLVLIYLFFFASVKSENSREYFQLGSKNGLITDDFYSGFQSKITNLYWFATSMGVSSFDGAKMENYEFKNPFFGLPCYKVIEDSLGRIWFYTSNGSLVVYDGYGFNSIAYSDANGGQVDQTIICDFWITNSKIFILSRGINNNEFVKLVSVDFKSLGKYFVKHEFIEYNKLNQYIVVKSKTLPVVVFNKENDNNYYRVNGSKVFFFSDKEIIEIKNNQVTLIYRFDKSKLNNVQYENEHFIVSTSNGMFLYFAEKELLIFDNQRITSGFFDNENNLFATTLNDGIMIKPSFFFKEILLDRKLDYLKIKSFKGNLFIVDKSFNLLLYNPFTEQLDDIFSNKEKYFSDPNVFIRANCVYFNKRSLQLGDGAVREDKINFIPFQSIVYSNNDYLISTGYADVKVIDSYGKKYKTLFYGKKVFDAKIDNNGFLWIATISGLYRGKVDFKSGLQIGKFDVFFKNSIVDKINFIKNKTLVLVNHKFINVIDGNQVQFNILKSTIANNKVIGKYIVIDSLSIMLNTDHGIYSIDFDLVNGDLKVVKSAFMAGFQRFLPKAIVDFDTIKNMIYIVSQNRLFLIEKNFGGGIISQSKCFFESVNTGKRVFDFEKIQKSSKLYFNNDENTIDINIINSFFNKPIVNEQFKYFLVYNLDTLEYKFSNSNWLRFYNLRFGDYSLIIQGRNSQNEWGETTVLSFNIKPKFVETKFFSGMIVVLFLIISALFLSLFFSNKNKKLLNENLLLENENYELQLLKSQLNPHFLFNSLNSLKGLIYLNRKDIALNYTDKLSFFLRSVLMSNQNLITTINDEINLIENYIEVEKVRLNNSIFLEIECDPRLLKVVIPSNILQPIIENSIKYALDINKELNIKIRCFRTESVLNLIVEDNGSGIKGINIQKSFSLEAIKRRIHVYNKKNVESCLILVNLRRDNKIIGVQTFMKIKIYENINY